MYEALRIILCSFRVLTVSTQRHKAQTHRHASKNPKAAY